MNRPDSLTEHEREFLRIGGRVTLLAEIVFWALLFGTLALQGYVSLVCLWSDHH